MTEKKQKPDRKFWIRVVCIVLAVIMIGSTFLAALGVF